MRSKPAVAVLSAILAGLLWVFLKETYWAVVIETATERFAEWLGIPRPAIMAAVAPFVLAFASASAVAWAAYALGVQERKMKLPLEFVYLPNDEKFVKKLEHKTRYFVGLHVISPKTVHFPSVRAIRGAFTDRVIEPHHGPGGSYLEGAVSIYTGGAIDPGVTEPIALFELPHRENLPKDETDLLRNKQTFTIEARCRDAKPCFATFEYDPDKSPMIRRIK
jgi:hypothetical protein